MRVLKNGEVRYKKAALDHAAWMNQSPHPLPIFRKGQLVQVYRGAGWSKGKVLASSRDTCSVRLSQGDKIVSLYDARCIKPIQSNNE
jgi:hypothetical protein